MSGRAWVWVLIWVVGAGTVGFWGGRRYERRQWRVASPALREVWRSKEGAFAERLRHAQRAVQLDDRLMASHEWEARAWWECSASPTKERETIVCLTRGLLVAADAESVLSLLAQAYRATGKGDQAASTEAFLRTLVSQVTAAQRPPGPAAARHWTPRRLGTGTVHAAPRQEGPS
jgi:hypothetical protein